ncbi:MAG: tRNA (uridine(34)/cytosine(34)/5-carboxymethylaminomethyluridine(34)-2'-O)-methyltransferase TrmL [Gammaproteobacteria bacterium]|nr:tRNA (uridine(34)/cytosine(34)/5-carboxymethylaminomethyluridine(34)-2'-O)-methyltransferase TrmL [Gammaproteobacteria bacterium]
MLHIALYQPEIPPNTGNIIRLCANTGAQLHLIHPLGFQLEDKHMRRAGLDYIEWANIKHYASFDEFQNQQVERRIFACSTKGSTRYSDLSYQDEDLFLFGQETKGLPPAIRERYPLITLPMKAQSRSLNLSNSAAIVLYEAWRQLGFL